MNLQPQIVMAIAVMSSLEVLEFDFEIAVILAEL